MTFTRAEDIPESDTLWWLVRRHFALLPIPPYIHRGIQFVLCDGEQETDYSVHSVRPGYLHRISNGQHPETWVDFFCCGLGQYGDIDDFFWVRNRLIREFRQKAIDSVPNLKEKKEGKGYILLGTTKLLKRTPSSTTRLPRLP